MISPVQMQKCKNPGSCHVIVVEDDPLLTMVIEFDLTHAGIHFCNASNGLEALDLIKSHQLKVLLLDISIPGLSGFEVIEALRADPSLTDLNSMHVVIHTSHDLSEDERRRLQFGKTLFLTKTQVTENLSDIVRKLLPE